MFSLRTTRATGSALVATVVFTIHGLLIPIAAGTRTACSGEHTNHREARVVVYACPAANSSLLIQTTWMRTTRGWVWNLWTPLNLRNRWSRAPLRVAFKLAAWSF